MTFNLGPQFRWNDRPPSQAAGIYAYFVAEPDQLLPVDVARPDGLLYIGMTNSSLDARCHFEHAHSGFSTFRRSLGAILKSQLQLCAVPRAPGSSRTNVLCYRFDPDGERRLTAWMRERLTYSFCHVAENVASVEKDEIKSACPPLNLTGWDNGDRVAIKRLRAACVAEAMFHRTSAAEMTTT